MLRGLACCLLLILVGCGSAPSSKPPARHPDDIGYKLAAVDAGRLIPEDDPSVARMRELVDRLEAACPEDRQDIGDVIVTAQKITKDNAKPGQAIPPLVDYALVVAESIEDLHRRGIPNPTCADTARQDALNEANFPGAIKTLLDMYKRQSAGNRPR